MLPDVQHTGPLSVTQAQSDAVWEVLEGNARVVALLRKHGREVSPVRGAGQAAPDPCAVRAEIRSTAGATSYAPTAGEGPAL